MIHQRGPCNDCNDPAYVPAHMNALFDGQRDFQAGDVHPFEGLPTTRSARDVLKAIQSADGHRWTRTKELLASLESPPSGGHSHKFDDPDIHESYVRMVGNDPGVRIFWLPGSPPTVIAATYYDPNP